MRRLLFLALVLATSAATARADDCTNATDQLTMDACAGMAAGKSDAELNSLYKQIVQHLKGDAGTMRLLVGTQRTWIAFRDAECDFSTSASVGGTVHPMVYDLCLDSMTQQRIKDFKRYLNCEEGDLSCPVPAN